MAAAPEPGIVLSLVVMQGRTGSSLSRSPATTARRWAAEIGYNHSFEVPLLIKR
jgi:hypothetical protein